MGGTRNLGDILSEREAIAQEMKETLDVATDPWGVTVERVELKDVRVPEQLMRAMAAEAEAAREARAKVIAAEGEHKASRALKHAAEVITDSPAALKLRYLQTLNSISAENNSTVIFPVPIDIINSFMTQPANNPMPPFQHYNCHQPQQQFHKAHMMNVKQRPPLAPTHSKVSKEDTTKMRNPTSVSSIIDTETDINFDVPDIGIAEVNFETDFDVDVDLN